MEIAKQMFFLLKLEKQSLIRLMVNLRDLFVILMSIVMVMRKGWLIVLIILWNLMLVVNITLKWLEWIVMVRTLYQE